MNPRAFDAYLRSVTASLIALAVVGTTLAELAANGSVPPALATPAGLIIGAYFGAHFAINGSGARKRADDDGPAKPAGG